LFSDEYFEIMKKIIIVLCCYSFVLCGGCKKGATSPSEKEPTPQDTIPQLPGWKLVWNDEFNGTAVDLTKWEYEVNGDGGGNNELQYYTARSSNSFVTNGTLSIQALKEVYLNKQYTSARMRTKGKGDWKYGRFEIRAKLPYGRGGCFRLIGNMAVGRQAVKLMLWNALAKIHGKFMVQSILARLQLPINKQAVIIQFRQHQQALPAVFILL
jgi:hypothetical protein